MLGNGMTDQPVKRKPGRPKKVVEDVGSANMGAGAGGVDLVGGSHSSGGADDLGRQSVFNGAALADFDHDGDGRPGGSKRKNAGVGKHELEALTREAFEAYDMQDDRIRFDSLARRWEFRMSSESGFWELRLSLSRGLTEIVDAVPQPVLGGSQGMSTLFDKIAKMDEAVR